MHGNQEEFIERGHAQIEEVRREIGRVVVGQHALVNRLLLGVLSRGHILLEGVPGLAKTTAVKALAATIRGSFQRIQFTPDLLPADIVGTEIYEPKTGEFRVRKGPVFHNIILADEINRAPSKVQSALLEAMQEKQVSLGGETFPLEEPFFVLATQNPIEQEGTYPLPEAQVDRFMLKINVDYPTRSEEQEIVSRMHLQESLPSPKGVLEKEDLRTLQNLIREIHVDSRVLEYAVTLVQATRNLEKYLPDMARYVQYGASPRGSIYIVTAAKAAAFLESRSYVTPQDIKNVAEDVLRHRVLMSYEGEAEQIDSSQVIQALFDVVEVP